jgi:hypothetical protein
VLISRGGVVGGDPISDPIPILVRVLIPILMGVLIRVLVRVPIPIPVRVLIPVLMGVLILILMGVLIPILVRALIPFLVRVLIPILVRVLIRVLVRVLIRVLVRALIQAHGSAYGPARGSVSATSGLTAEDSRLSLLLMSDGNQPNPLYHVDDPALQRLPARKGQMESLPLFAQPGVHTDFDPNYTAVLHTGDALKFLQSLPDGLATLIISSPPYNLGKEYERRQNVRAYLDGQAPVLAELARVLADNGSLCWEVGNYVDNGEVIPLDVLYYPIFAKLGLKMRNRIIWSFGHGLHASRRFSGRYEVIMWMTKSDNYKFNLDAVRVPSKYPGKTHFKGAKKGLPSGNPLGKNPSDMGHTKRQGEPPGEDRPSLPIPGRTGRALRARAVR